MAAGIRAAASAVAPAAASALPRAPHLIRDKVDQLARKTATAVRLEDLYQWGQGDTKTRLKMAGFLHREVAIRTAQLCKELQVLPFGLAETQGVSNVIKGYMSDVDTISSSRRPESKEDDVKFTVLLKDIWNDRLNYAKQIGSGVKEVEEALGNGYEDIRGEIDLMLDRFFMKRIGLRFLMEHYIESAESRPGISGIIHGHVRVGRVLKKSAREARKMCEDLYGSAPDIIITGDGQASEIDCYDRPGASIWNPGASDDWQFTFVPKHLEFACSVLLQNACFSVAERFSSSVNADGAPMPAVEVNYAHGEDEVTIRVSDMGGGLPRSKIHLAWSYFCSHTGTGSSQSAWRHSAPLGFGNPLGAGLPLARLHARYYGGDLTMQAIDGCSTDAYLFLSRLGQNCEHIPHGVRVSPSMRDSSVKEAVTTMECLGDMKQAEIDFLRLRLAEFRKKKAESVAMLSSVYAP